MSASDNKNTKIEIQLCIFFYIKYRIQTILQQSKIWVDRKTTKFLKLVLLSRVIFQEKTFRFCKNMKNNVFIIMSHPNVLRNTPISIVNTDVQCIYFANLLYLISVIRKNEKHQKLHFCQTHVYKK